MEFELVGGLHDIAAAESAASVRRPITNGDRIRAMSDEELAAWICTPDCDAESWETCITITTEKTFDVPWQEQTDPLHDVAYWLRQPADRGYT